MRVCVRGWLSACGVTAGSCMLGKGPWDAGGGGSDLAGGWVGGWGGVGGRQGEGGQRGDLVQGGRRATWRLARCVQHMLRPARVDGVLAQAHRWWADRWMLVTQAPRGSNPFKGQACTQHQSKVEVTEKALHASILPEVQPQTDAKATQAQPRWAGACLLCLLMRLDEMAATSLHTGRLGTLPARRSITGRRITEGCCGCFAERGRSLPSRYRGVADQRGSL